MSGKVNQKKKCSVYWIPEPQCCLTTKKPEYKQRQYCNRFDEDFKNGPYQKIKTTITTTTTTKPKDETE